MSPTPTPTPIPLPDHLEGSLGTSPSGLDGVLTEAAETAANSNSDFGENLDAALDGIARIVPLTGEYFPDLGYVMFSAAPWVIAVIAVFSVAVFVAAIIGATFVGMNRGEKRALRQATVAPTDPVPANLDADR